MDCLLQIPFLVKVSERGSLSEAAEALGPSDAAAGWYLTVIEDRLGARFVERTPRRL